MHKRPKGLQKQRRIKQLWAMTALLLCSTTTTTTTGHVSPTKDHSYDTNSFLIGIDNHASYSMTNSKKDFIGQPTKVNVRIKGIKGHSTSVLRGTVKWTIQDDDGTAHDIHLPNTYFMDSLPLRLLSPQHLAQTYDTNPDGTISYTTADSVVLLGKTNATNAPSSSMTPTTPPTQPNPCKPQRQHPRSLLLEFRGRRIMGIQQQHQQTPASATTMTATTALNET